jgi:hypothetical protein
MNKIDLNFKLISSNGIGLFEGKTEWESSNAKIIQEHCGNCRSGYAGKYKVFNKAGNLIKEIPFSYTGSLKSELEKINLDSK